MIYAALYFYFAGVPMAACLDDDAPSWRGVSLALAWPVSFPAVLIASIIRVTLKRVRK